MNFLKKFFSKPEAPEQPPEFLREEAPEWFIRFKEDHADGTSSEVRLSLHEAAHEGLAQVISRAGEEMKQSVTVELTRQEFDRLKVILGFSFPDDITNAPAGTEEESATISVFKREPFMVRSGICNLAGWLDSKKSGPPVIEIGKILVEAKRRAPAA
jgi:hypothetical protein